MTQLIARPPSHDATAPPIQVEGLSLYFNGTVALEDVTFNLPVGQLVAVVGPNGAGKTTLFSIIAGTRKPSAGTVHVYGHGPRGHVCIAYVPQRSHVDWGFPATVGEVVMMGRIRKIGLFHWPKGHDWRLVRGALQRADMLQYKDKQIGELSGGQQQRVFLAQALAQEAEVILLDEPFTGLDLPSQEAIFNFLMQLRDEGVAIMVATHDLNLATQRFDLVMLLNRRMVAFGTPEEAFTQDHLLEAYGGNLHLIESKDGTLVFTDTCCDGEEGHHSHG